LVRGTFRQRCSRRPLQPRRSAALRRKRAAVTTTLPAAASMLAADARFLPIEGAVPVPATRAEAARHTTLAMPEPIQRDAPRRAALGRVLAVIGCPG